MSPQPPLPNLAPASEILPPSPPSHPFFSTGCYSPYNSLGPTLFLYCSHHTLCSRKPLPCNMKVKCAIFSEELIGHRNSAICTYLCHVLNPVIVICWSVKSLWRDVSSSALLITLNRTGRCLVKLTLFWHFSCSEPWSPLLSYQKSPVHYMCYYRWTWNHGRR